MAVIRDSAAAPDAGGWISDEIAGSHPVRSNAGFSFIQYLMCSWSAEFACLLILALNHQIIYESHTRNVMP